MKNIYLVGFMGTGKTTVGKIIAQRLGKEFREIDELIEKDQGKAISAIFAEDGESYFRQLENNLLGQICKKTDLLVSCGGGLICNPENLKLLKQSGLVICLTASAEIIYARTKRFAHRPLLQVDNPLRAIDELLTKRKPYYEQAHYLVDTDKLSPDEVTDKIIKLVKNNG